MSILVMLGLATVAPDTAPALARHAAMTAIVVRCTRPTDANAIVVCGKRAADKWREPLIGYDAGDPRAESVSGERNRLASEPRQDCGNTAFFGQAKCGGMVGVTVGVDLGGGALRWRPVAD